jgi:hypothetical protein
MRVRSLWWIVVTVVAFLVCFVPSRVAAGTITYDVQAFVDTQDQLIIQDNTLQWHHLVDAAVGRWNGSNFPTIISTAANGVVVLSDLNWVPDWPEPPPAEIRYEAYSSVFEDLVPALPSCPMTVTLDLIQARDTADLTQLPTPDNGQTLVVNFWDGLPGADWYHIQVQVTYPTTFPDVPVDYWAYSQITACVNAHIVAGYLDGTYKPTDPVTRDQMAVYISRALAGGDAAVPTGPATATFSDVPTDYWAFKYVEYAVEQNVVKGYSDGTYKPTDEVTRDQMSVFVARAIATPTAGVDLVNYTPPTTATFPDVPTSFWAYKYVEYIAQPSVAVTKGYPDGDYHPEYVCTRDQMAVYVARAFKLPL